jgi:hypothetical protein
VKLKGARAMAAKSETLRGKKEKRNKKVTHI